MDAEGSLSDSECRTLSIRQGMQCSLYRTADARMYQTANAGPFLGDSGCRRHSIIKVNAGLYQTAMLETLYGTADAGDTL